MVLCDCSDGGGTLSKEEFDFALRQYLGAFLKGKL